MKRLEIPTNQRPQTGMIRAVRDPQIGDILEIRSARGLAYAQLTHRHRWYGPLLRVLAGYFQRRPPLSRTLLGATRFYAFAPIEEAVRGGLFLLVGNAEAPPRARRFQPPVFLGSLVEGLDRPPKWRYWDGEREWLEAGPRPTQEDVSVLFPGYLVRLLDADSRPSVGDVLHRGDAAVAQPAQPDGTPERAHNMAVFSGPARHFLYFRSERDISDAAASARRLDLASETKKIDDEWVLVVTDRSFAPSDIDATAKELASLAAAAGGEYDGWEVTATTPTPSRN